MRLPMLIVALLAVPAMARDTPTGYLPPARVKALLRQIPEPPAPGSPADRLDRQRYAAAKAGIGNPAWQRAIGQVSYNSSVYRKQMSCALGITVGPKTTPAAAAVLARAATDARTLIDLAQDYFQRDRPFHGDHGDTCDPRSRKDNGIRMGYSYPSGHATTGLLWGMILADMLPDRRSKALAFGRETGDLRVACRVHWQSDVAAGQQLAATLYTLIAAQPAYRAEVAKARAELATSPRPQGC